MTKFDVTWDPSGNNDFYIAHSNELCLYHLENRPSPLCHNETASNLVFLPISDEHSACLLSKVDEISLIKCYKPHPNEAYARLIAFGQGNGRVLVGSAVPSLNEHIWIGKEFVPKHSRYVGMYKCYPFVNF